jgi:hypothetical protein
LLFFCSELINLFTCVKKKKQGGGALHCSMIKVGIHI